MTGLTVGLGIYLLIGIVFAQLGAKHSKQGLDTYEKGLQELLDKKDQKETFEEKMEVRNEILEFDKKYEFVLNNKQHLDLLNNETMYKRVYVLVVIAWLPALMKVIINNKK